MTADDQPPRPGTRAVASVVRRLERVRASLLDIESSVDLGAYGNRRESARNLLHYLAFRRFDLRPEQTRLARWALSSLGRSEGHVLFTLDSVLAWLRQDGPSSPASRAPMVERPGPEQGQATLEENARALLGPKHRGRSARIMVTMPSEAAADHRIARDLIGAGMDCARINCAHDGPDAWAQMIRYIRQAERTEGRRCWIEMDLAGPKIRTGPMEPGPAVIKVRPKRDALGRIVLPASVWLVPPRHPVGEALRQQTLTVPSAWLRTLRRNQRVKFTDGRGARRTMRIVETKGTAVRAELEKTAYITYGTRLRAETARGGELVVRVGAIPPSEQRIRLEVGERLVMTARSEPGTDATRDGAGRILRPARIACTLPEALSFVRTGESIWLDDGRIGGIVRSASPRRLLIEVTHAPAGGAWLAADKGINLPETELELPPLTPRDRKDLRFAVRHADVLGYSFVHRPSDIDDLRAELSRLGRPLMGIFLKVETRRAFDELPGLLLGALRQPPVGVMIARGDLAVELGFERLAEVQEEILWLCEAAHLPAIWATQVLEGLTKTGLPSRAEVTDAAMGERAECVMLNKGPHVVEAVRALNSILHRMQSHQSKKTAMLRHLRVVERFAGDATAAPNGLDGSSAHPTGP